MEDHTRRNYDVEAARPAILDKEDMSVLIRTHALNAEGLDEWEERIL